ncbi:hypothetical protein [Dyella terrae]|uniref:hypothetical protein n=1 Tax=Dyella terrae TaxID=522259 RepID=UPI001EFDD19F|nr:hypothetical protein [Dyella terrae]
MSHTQALGDSAVRIFNAIPGAIALCLMAAPTMLCAEDAQIPAAYLLDGAPSPIAVYVAAVEGEGEAGSATGLGSGVDNSTLAGMSGGTLVTQNTNLNGTVTNDSADHVISGANVITGGSFSGEVGIPTVIQNSGSNVLIQNATVISVEFKP